MNFDDTYFPLFRSMITHRYMTDANKFQFWVWCLLKASHKPHKVLVGNQTIELQVGQFVFGRKKAAEELGTSEQSIRTLLKFFSSEREQKLTIKSTSKYSIITVVKYACYMEKAKKSNQQINQRLTSTQPAPNHKQEGIEGKEIKTIKTRGVFQPPTIEEVSEYCKERNNNVSPENWFDHYTANGWKVGKNKMQDWKAAIRTWEKGAKPKNSIQQEKIF